MTSSSTSDIYGVLARRLTDRDRWIARLLFDHQVLTTDHIHQLGFESRDATQHRLVILHRLGVVERFRPFRSSGSAPFHYVLGPTGVAVVAAALDVDVKSLNYRRDRLLTLAHHPRLTHLLGVNGFFCDLAGATRRNNRLQLVEWWSERQCDAEWGSIVRPDGFGIWRDGDARVAFFLEYDRGTETLQRVVAKLDNYDELQVHGAVVAPVLFWFQSEARQRNFARLVRSATGPLAMGNYNNGRPAQAVWELPQHRGPRLRLGALQSR